MTITFAETSTRERFPAEPGEHLLRAEFYLCLARAFMTPLEPEIRRAMKENLADDLEELGNSLGLDLAGPIAEYRAAMSELPSEDALLHIYSKLFLTPPAPVRINACLYLDGAILGRACDELSAAYRSWGIEKREDFRDLPDHVSTQLEFAGYAFAIRTSPPGADPATAVEFLGRHVAPWVTPFVAALEAASAGVGVVDPYAPLGRILARAVHRDVPLAPESERDAKEAGVLAARQEWRERGLKPKDLETIARRLREHGLAADHVDTPCELRDAERGWEHRRPR